MDDKKTKLINGVEKQVHSFHPLIYTSQLKL